MESRAVQKGGGHVSPSYRNNRDDRRPPVHGLGEAASSVSCRPLGASSELPGTGRDREAKFELGLIVNECSHLSRGSSA